MTRGWRVGPWRRRRYYAAHLFCGSGGGARGFQESGFALAGAIDIDPRCGVDFERLLGEAIVLADIEAMQPADVSRAIRRCPDVLFLSSPCDGYSGCNSVARSKTEKYQRLNALALHGVRLAIMAWGRRKPRVILFENVPGIAWRGADLLAQLTLELSAAGYVVDQRSHECGEIGGLGQVRRRFLLIARDPETCPEPIQRPPLQRVRSIREVIEEYPVPRPAPGDDPMHALQPLSELNWLRLAAIRAGGDWQTLPAAGVEIVRCATEDVERAIAEDWGPSGTLDPAVPWDRAGYGGRPQCYGVADPAEPSVTVRGRHEVQNCRAAVPDRRVAVGLGCAPRSGAYGVAASGTPARTVLGAHCYDNAQGTVCDVRLGHATRRGAFEVQAGDRPARTVRGHHEVRQAPGAVEDRRVGVAYDERGWAVPTHVLVRRDDGRFVLYGPARAWSKRGKSHVCIESRVDGDPLSPGTWKRPLTVRELAALQGYPPDFVFCGPRTSGKSGTGQVKRIGNSVPVGAARAIAGQVMAALVASDSRQRLMSLSGVWVRRAVRVQKTDRTVGPSVDVQDRCAA